MVGQVEHEIGLFCLRTWVLYAILWEVLSVLLLVYALIGLLGTQTCLIHFAVVI